MAAVYRVRYRFRQRLRMRRQRFRPRHACRNGHGCFVSALAWTSQGFLIVRKRVMIEI